MIHKILKNLSSGIDGIYFCDFSVADQEEEIKLRRSVASVDYQDYLETISLHHSVPVMDKEVDIFVRKIPQGGLVLDVGGCWGWHWRRLSKNRPDITLIILDLVKENLIHTKKLLNFQINKNIFLVHGDATSLKFDDNTFDGWWSVQTLQHIPNFETAIKEAYRTLKPGGIFANYSLNNQKIVRIICKIMGINYHIHGQLPGAFYLSRASEEQYDKITKIFSNKVTRRYTEVLFSPELHLSFPGKQNSFFGKCDSFMSMNSGVFSTIARQQSFHTFKVG